MNKRGNLDDIDRILAGSPRHHGKRAVTLRISGRERAGDPVVVRARRIKDALEGNPAVRDALLEEIAGDISSGPWTEEPYGDGRRTRYVRHNLYGEEVAVVVERGDGTWSYRHELDAESLSDGSDLEGFEGNPRFPTAVKAMHYCDAEMRSMGAAVAGLGEDP